MISFPGSLLERDEHEHEPLALFQAGHRLADDRALRLRRVSDLHRVAGRARCRQQIAGLDRALRSVTPSNRRDRSTPPDACRRPACLPDSSPCPA